MSRFNIHNVEELSEGNRYYWRIPKGIPVGYETVTIEFILHDKPWKYTACFTYDDILRVDLYSISEEDDPPSWLWTVQGGIIGDDQKELVVLEADACSDNGKRWFVVGYLIPKSELCDMMLANKVLYIFIDMKNKKDEKAQFVQKIKARLPLPYGNQSIKSSSPQITPGTSHTRKIETDFKEMLLSGKDSDVTIQVKRKKFMCHRNILNARSPVFSAMMDHDMKEKASGNVTIKDAEPTTFKEFLLYLYTGNEEHLNRKNLTDLYKLGDKYYVEDLKSLCVKYIKKDITVENFYEYFLLSQQHNDSELKDATIKFFLEYSKEIVGSDNWMPFLSKNLIECNVLITALANK